MKIEMFTKYFTAGFPIPSIPLKEQGWQWRLRIKLYRYYIKDDVIKGYNLDPKKKQGLVS